MEIIDLFFKSEVKFFPSYMGQRSMDGANLRLFIPYTLQTTDKWI